ncbi:hypothetical protein [Haemophilus parahaemolyticus]|uniref:hypothetical protein n=1 Tax=Haemophilus parahaemolyticus TaxID=735 RepID=UPI0029090AC7|nr:hypothetical protein [Haemophilus parahaemolyticus]MDU4465727.1 hypothetical protein [Haemophilus parahaemolyticus]
MKKVSFLQFLFKIGDDYLMFLRNLTPAVLFLSLALFMFSELDWVHWGWSDVPVLFLCLASGFIALSVMAINTVAFVREMLKTLRTLSGESELDENIGKSNSKQLIFFAVVNIVAVFMVLVYGTKYALNFYSSISTLND